MLENKPRYYQFYQPQQLFYARSNNNICWMRPLGATRMTGYTLKPCSIPAADPNSVPLGVFVSSWLGGLLLQVGEWIIKKLPLVKHIYSAAKQVSGAVNPANESTASFRECVIIRHPRQGELAFGFITGSTTLVVSFSRFDATLSILYAVVKRLVKQVAVLAQM